MALNQTRPLSQDEMQSDRVAMFAIRELPDYTPINPIHSADSLMMLETALTQAQQDELRIRNALEGARDTTIAAAWALHNAVLGAKAQVIAQYGYDSNAVQSIGLKKKSERKRPMRRTAASAMKE